MVKVCHKMLLLRSCFCLAILLVGTVSPQEHADVLQAESNANNQATNTTLMRCWYCLTRSKSWSECQNNKEVDFCTPDPVTGEVSCLRSSLQVQRASGDTNHYRYAGCAKDQTALNKMFQENYGVSFNQTSPTINTTLVQFDTCSGTLCNLMYENGNSNDTKPNASSVRGPLAGLIVILVGLVAAIK